MMIKIYYASLEQPLSNTDFQAHMQLLPRLMQDKISRLKRLEDQQVSLIGKLLLKKGLMDLGFEHVFAQVQYSSYGRPYVDDELDFNISHSGCYVVCAFSVGGTIGVDIELVRELDMQDFERVFHHEEWAAIQSAENRYRFFFDYWTAKESVIKAIGKGMSIPLKSIFVSNQQSIFKESVWYHKQILLFDQCICQIASDKLIDDVDLYEMKF
ncbi:4'-phosphopantetheinyl transferase superfamily protein [Sphingobacterium faecium]|uniref:4'-phosphopantetheinyl transferase family protein n=1 Tax=Sphingobacterium faecium TaxID=34087 RepID=UPI0032086F11